MLCALVLDCAHALDAHSDPSSEQSPEQTEKSPTDKNAETGGTATGTGSGQSLADNAAPALGALGLGDEELSTALDLIRLVEALKGKKNAETIPAFDQVKKLLDALNEAMKGQRRASLPEETRKILQMLDDAFWLYADGERNEPPKPPSRPDGTAGGTEAKPPAAEEHRSNRQNPVGEGPAPPSSDQDNVLGKLHNLYNQVVDWGSNLFANPSAFGTGSGSYTGSVDTPEPVSPPAASPAVDLAPSTASLPPLRSPASISSHGGGPTLQGQTAEPNGVTANRNPSPITFPPLEDGASLPPPPRKVVRPTPLRPISDPLTASGSGGVATTADPVAAEVPPVAGSASASANGSTGAPPTVISASRNAAPIAPVTGQTAQSLLPLPPVGAAAGPSSPASPSASTLAPATAYVPSQVTLFGTIREINAGIGPSSPGEAPSSGTYEPVAFSAPNSYYKDAPFRPLGSGGNLYLPTSSPEDDSEFAPKGPGFSLGRAAALLSEAPDSVNSSLLPPGVPSWGGNTSPELSQAASLALSTGPQKDKGVALGEAADPSFVEADLAYGMEELRLELPEALEEALFGSLTKKGKGSKSGAVVSTTAGKKGKSDLDRWLKKRGGEAKKPVKKPPGPLAGERVL